MALKDALFSLYYYEWQPDTLMADAVGAIQNGFMRAFGYNSTDDFNRLMCWPHVQRNCKKNVHGAHADSIIHDINMLQVAHSIEVFNFEYGLFQKKWSKVKDETVDAFLIYFDRQWIQTQIGLFLFLFIFK